MKTRWIALVGLLALAGCDPEYGTLRIREGAGEFNSAYVGSDGVVVEEGHVIIAFAEPIAAGGTKEYQGLERFQVEAANPSIATVSRGVLRDSFVIAGARIGNTRLEVLINGEIVDTVPLEVVEQGGAQ